MENFHIYLKVFLSIAIGISVAGTLFCFYLLVYKKRDLDFYIKKIDGKKTPKPANSFPFSDINILFFRYFFKETPEINKLPKRYKINIIKDLINEINSFYTFLKFSIPAFAVCTVLFIVLYSKNI